MGQEFIIKSQALEDKVNQLLPSQGGFQAGVDLSASTTIIPIVDLTESAEGSDVRQDLQTAFSLDSITFTSTNNTTNDIIINTGYYRVFGYVFITGAGDGRIQFTDGATTKILINIRGSAGDSVNQSFDTTVFLKAGDSVQAYTSSTAVTCYSVTRQIADISGNLVNP